MSYNIYLQIDDISDGASSEASIGQMAKTEHADDITVLALSWGMYIPTDRLSGQITGNRRHEHLTITKLLDVASPPLAQHLTNPLPLVCTFEFYRPGDITETEDAEAFYTIILEGAKVTKIQVNSPNLLLPENDNIPATEEVTFAYNKVSVEHVSGGEFEDHWTGE